VKLIPAIASYSGETAARMRRYLDDEALDVIAAVAVEPRAVEELDAGVLSELSAMHVLRRDRLAESLRASSRNMGMVSVTPRHQSPTFSAAL